MTQPLLDQMEVSQVLFYPRRAYGLASAPGGARSIVVEVEPGIVLGGWLYSTTPGAPAILFFHGNGEIAEDYDDIAPLYTQLGITLLVMDYRGYGTRGGTPTANYLSCLITSCTLSMGVKGCLWVSRGL